MSETLRARVLERLNATGQSARSAALKAGLSDGAVRNILRGRSPGAQMRTLNALAPVLGVSVAWLMGQTTDLGDAANENPQLVEAPSQTLPIKYEVGAGYWVELDHVTQVNYGSSVVMKDPVYSPFEQWLERVVGDSMDRDYPPGSLVHVVDAVSIGYAPRHGDHVILEVTRHQGLEMERSVKEVVMTPDGPEFWPRSNNPRWQKPVSLTGEVMRRQESSSDDSIEIRVAGLVLGSYRPRRA